MTNYFITEYKVLHARAPDRLAEAVNEAIKQGWQPIGGVASLGAPVLAQAMVKS